MTRFVCDSSVFGRLYVRSSYLLHKHKYTHTHTTQIFKHSHVPPTGPHGPDFLDAPPVASTTSSSYVYEDICRSWWGQVNTLALGESRSTRIIEYSLLPGSSAQASLLTGSAHCGTLQQNAAQCNATQHNARYCNTMVHTSTHRITLHYTSTQCSSGTQASLLTGSAHATECHALQHTAAHCNTLQHTATRCNTLQQRRSGLMTSWLCLHCSAVPCAAVCCSVFFVLQCVAGCCSVLLCVVVCCRQVLLTLHHTLQHTAAH